MNSTISEEGEEEGEKIHIRVKTLNNNTFEFDGVDVNATVLEFQAMVKEKTWNRRESSTNNLSRKDVEEYRQIVHIQNWGRTHCICVRDHWRQLLRIVVMRIENRTRETEDANSSRLYFPRADGWKRWWCETSRFVESTCSTTWS